MANLEPLGVTRRDAATILGISVSTIKNMEHVGKLRTYRVGARNYGVRVTMQSIRDQAGKSKR